MTGVSQRDQATILFPADTSGFAEHGYTTIGKARSLEDARGLCSEPVVYAILPPRILRGIETWEVIKPHDGSPTSVFYARKWSHPDDDTLHHYRPATVDDITDEMVG